MRFNSGFKGLNNFEINNYIRLACLTCFETSSNFSVLLDLTKRSPLTVFWSRLFCHLYFVTPPPLHGNFICIFRRKGLKEKIRTVDHRGRNCACWQSDERNILCDNTTTLTILPRGTINLNLVAHIFETWCIIYASRYSSIILAMNDKTVISLNRRPYSCSTCCTYTLCLLGRKVDYECVERNEIV